MVALLALAVGGCAAGSNGERAAPKPVPPPAPPAPLDQLLAVPGGTFTAGEQYGVDNGRADERLQQKTVAAFELMRTCTTRRSARASRWATMRCS